MFEVLNSATLLWNFLNENIECATLRAPPNERNKINGMQNFEMTRVITLQGSNSRMWLLYTL
jgi:hypothetical protein